MKKTILSIFIFVIFLILFSFLYSNYYIINYTKDDIYTIDKINFNYDKIIVLGSGIYGTRPSPLLKERLDRSIELYQKRKSYIVLSGDHSETRSEVNVMKKYLLEKGVLEEDISLDYNGFSTFESMENLDKKNILIVTQKYHLYRSVYIARYLGIDAHGVIADKEVLQGESYREGREVLARTKDFFKVLIKISSFKK